MTPEAKYAAIVTETIGPKNWRRPLDEKMFLRVVWKLEQLCPDFGERLAVGASVQGFLKGMRK